MSLGGVRSRRVAPRWIAAVLVSGGLALAGCGGGTSSATPFSNDPACRDLAALATNGLRVADLDVSDPEAFAQWRRLRKLAPQPAQQSHRVRA